MKRASVMLFGASCLLLQAGQVHADSWYLSAESNCSGTEPVMAAFVALLPSSIPVHAGGSPAYIDLAASTFNKFSGANNEAIIDDLELDKSKAADFRKSMELVAAGYSVPYFVDVGASIYTSFVLTAPVAGAAAGLVFSYFLDKLREPSAAMTGFALFVADGGHLQRRWKFLTDPNKGIYGTDSLEYKIILGKEVRRFVIAGCLYPANIIVNEFDTSFPTANKIVKPYNGAWGVFDVDDNKWDSTVLRYVDQDQEFYYFSEDAIENGVVKGQHVHRISFQGGKWQYKDFFDGPDATFKTLASGMVAR